MATDLNRVVLVGRLTRDPELRSTPNGTMVCKIGIAVNRTIWRKEGEKEEKAYFFDCVAFGRQAEVINQYLRKGRRIGIDGYLTQNSWEDANGNRRSKVEITIENFQFLESKSATEYPSSDPVDSQFMGAQEVESQANFDMNDDDVPF
ncbi:MAG: single-stranded DNA-binding protein [Candidatus Hydrogenedentota bacterium]|nr:MAG: single-stranded DNA-binding protein [Candidatus Hydrogenedentota bacterium]